MSVVSFTNEKISIPPPPLPLFRSALLAEQEQRARLESTLTAERRQLAFLQKRVVRLEAELRTAAEQQQKQQRNTDALKLALDQYTVFRV